VLSIVMPAFDEAELLESSVRAVVGGVRARGHAFEVIVVENGSTDGTAALVDRLVADSTDLRAEHLAIADYGVALRHGILSARGDVIATFDVDYYDLAFLDRALALVDGPDSPAIVVASKRATGANDTRPWTRRAVTAIFTRVLHLGFGLHVSDTHGMKVLRADVITPLARRCHFGADLFDTELVLRAERAGLRTAELPVLVEERRPARTPIWRRLPRTLTGLVRLRVALWRHVE
jgi:glycosyltransferase involved in cell wall biosynthesis